jgi:hypothetical protein
MFVCLIILWPANYGLWSITLQMAEWCRLRAWIAYFWYGCHWLNFLFFNSVLSYCFHLFLPYCCCLPCVSSVVRLTYRVEGPLWYVRCSVVLLLCFEQLTAVVMVTFCCNWKNAVRITLPHKGNIPPVTVGGSAVLRILLGGGSKRTFFHKQYGRARKNFFNDSRREPAFTKYYEAKLSGLGIPK